MTDYAYNTLLAGASFAEGGPMSARLRIALGRLKATDPTIAPFFAAVCCQPIANCTEVRPNHGLTLPSGQEL
ncbi:hypothetical protein [Ideonella sp. YS5]|uniref:hypothetical protein n=1 Tax=Ideonella sp. YS5 TaxID=3453714 RepID=UPI003EEEFE34